MPSAATPATSFPGAATVGDSLPPPPPPPPPLLLLGSSNANRAATRRCCEVDTLSAPSAPPPPLPPLGATVRREPAGDASASTRRSASGADHEGRLLKPARNAALGSMVAGLGRWCACPASPPAAGSTGVARLRLLGLRRMPPCVGLGIALAPLSTLPPLPRRASGASSRRGADAGGEWCADGAMLTSAVSVVAAGAPAGAAGGPVAPKLVARPNRKLRRRDMELLPTAALRLALSPLLPPPKLPPAPPRPPKPPMPLPPPPPLPPPTDSMEFRTRDDDDHSALRDSTKEAREGARRGPRAASPPPAPGMAMGGGNGSFHTSKKASPMFLFGAPPAATTSPCTMAATSFTHARTSPCNTSVICVKERMSQNTKMACTTSPRSAPCLNGLSAARPGGDVPPSALPASPNRVGASAVLLKPLRSRYRATTAWPASPNPSCTSRHMRRTYSRSSSASASGSAPLAAAPAAPAALPPSPPPSAAYREVGPLALPVRRQAVHRHARQQAQHTTRRIAAARAAALACSTAGVIHVAGSAGSPRRDTEAAAAVGGGGGAGAVRGRRLPAAVAAAAAGVSVAAVGAELLLHTKLSTMAARRMRGPASSGSRATTYARHSTTTATATTTTISSPAAAPQAARRLRCDRLSAAAEATNAAAIASWRTRGTTTNAATTPRHRCVSATRACTAACKHGAAGGIGRAAPFCSGRARGRDKRDAAATVDGPPVPVMRPRGGGVGGGEVLSRLPRLSPLLRRGRPPMDSALALLPTPECARARCGAADADGRSNGDDTCDTRRSPSPGPLTATSDARGVGDARPRLRAAAAADARAAAATAADAAAVRCASSIFSASVAALGRHSRNSSTAAAKMAPVAMPSSACVVAATTSACGSGGVVV